MSERGRAGVVRRRDGARGDSDGDEKGLDYGLACFGGHGLMTSFAGCSLAGAGENTWLSGVRWRLGPYLSLAVETTQREAASDSRTVAVFAMFVITGLAASRAALYVSELASCHSSQWTFRLEPAHQPAKA